MELIINATQFYYYFSPFSDFKKKKKLFKKIAIFVPIVYGFSILYLMF